MDVDIHPQPWFTWNCIDKFPYRLKVAQGNSQWKIKKIKTLQPTCPKQPVHLFPICALSELIFCMLLFRFIKFGLIVNTGFTADNMSQLLKAEYFDYLALSTSLHSFAGHCLAFKRESKVDTLDFNFIFLLFSFLCAFAL